MRKRRWIAGLIAIFLAFGLTACTKTPDPVPDPTPVTNPTDNPGVSQNEGGDKPIQTGPGEPVKEPEPLKGEKEGDIPVALRMVRETRSHSKAFYYGEYGQGMMNSRAMTACEMVYPADDFTFSELAATLGEHFDRRDETLAGQVEELYDYAAGLSPDEALWTVPVGFAAVDGVYLRFETTLHRADTRVVSFTEELYTNFDADARSFVTTNIDTQTGAILALDDVLDHLPEAHALIESKIKETFGDVEPPDEYAFTVDWQGITLYFDYPELDFLAEAPTIWLGFAEYPDYIKSYYREVPDAFAVSYKAIEEHGFDRDGDGTTEGLIPAGEWGENWLLYKNGKTYLANFTNNYNPWERLMDSEADWECHLYAIDESGPDFLWIYPGKPFGNELTNPDDFSLQTRVELLDSNAREEGNPYTPVTVHVCLNDEGALADPETGLVWKPELPDYSMEFARSRDLFGTWSSSFVADDEGNEIQIHLEFYENGYMYYWFDKGDGRPLETYSGRYRTNHNIPGTQFSGGTVPFVLFFNGGSNYKNDPYEFWSMNDITFPETDNWDVIRIESWGDLLGHRGGRAGEFGDYEFYRTY